MKIATACLVCLAIALSPAVVVGVIGCAATPAHDQELAALRELVAEYTSAIIALDAEIHQLKSDAIATQTEFDGRTFRLEKSLADLEARVSLCEKYPYTLIKPEGK